MVAKICRTLTRAASLSRRSRWPQASSGNFNDNEVESINKKDSFSDKEFQEYIYLISFGVFCLSAFFFLSYLHFQWSATSIHKPWQKQSSGKIGTWKRN